MNTAHAESAAPRHAPYLAEPELLVAPLAEARARILEVVTRYPKSSLLGAFALGYLIARVARHLTEE